MGGGPHIEGNQNNLKEADDDLKNRIRPIELVKHNPQLFHLNFWSSQNQYDILGGGKTCLLALIGGFTALAYFRAGRLTRPYNYYVDVHLGFGRFFFGAIVGTGVGYLKWGDRQKLHNAYTAERLRKRYPQCLELKSTDLWQYKGVEATHGFYGWK